MMKPDFPFSGSNPGNKRFSVCSRGAPQGASHVALLFLSSISHHRMEDQWCKANTGKSWVTSSSDEDQWCKHREKCTAPSVTSSSEEDQWCKHTEKCTFWEPYPITKCHKQFWRGPMVQKHEKVHFLEAIYLHHLSQVVLKRINGADTQKSALSGSHIPAPCVTSSFEVDQWCKHTRKCTFWQTMSLHHMSQVVLKRINGAITQKSALSGSRIPLPSVTSSSEEEPWCKNMEKCTFWKPYPCTICHKQFRRGSMVQTHGKVHFLGTISLHQVSQVNLKRIHGAKTKKGALSGSYNPAPCTTSTQF